MQYMLLFYDTEPNLSPPLDATEKQAYLGAWNAYMDAMQSAGVVRAGEELQSAKLATCVKVRNEKRHVQDGPFADTKEELGGFVVIEVPTLDDALAWAARCPTAATGTVEVRPVVLNPLQAS